MTPIMIAWLAAIAGGATVGKLLGAFLRARSLGLIGNPVTSLLGGVAAWQIAVVGKVVPESEWLPALIIGLLGGGIALVVASRFKSISG